MSEPRRKLDPTGKRALFETPVTAADEVLRRGEAPRGRDALFSTGRPQAGTVLVECSRCSTRTRVGLADIAVRLASFSVYLPLLRPKHPHRIRCPHCDKASWCRVGWGE